MHEVSIASSIIKTVQSQALKHPGERFTKVGLRIGALAGIDPDALSFGWDALTKDTELDGVALEIEQIPRRQRCSECNEEFEVRDYLFECPGCGNPATTFVGGDELDIAYIEVDDHDRAAAD